MSSSSTTAAEPAKSGIRSMESSHKQLTVLRCKLVIVGDACVGKTALTQMFQSGGALYPKNYSMTVGAEFCVKQVPIPNTNIVVELYIFDCGGQSMFNQLEMGNGKYYEDASAVMVVYDVSSADSLKACGKWLEAVRQMQGKDGPSRWLIGALVGNKKDFRDGRVDSRAEVNFEDAQQMSKSLGLKGFFESSALNNEGIEDPFKFIAEEFYKRYEEQGQVLDGNMGMGMGLGSPGGSPTNRRGGGGGRGGLDF